MTSETVPRLEFTNPTYEQQCGIEGLNIVLGWLAIAYGVDGDVLNERAGAAVEAVIAELRDDRPTS